ncbi:MAG: transcriptional repressor LexA [Pseudomonadota bacterium]
MLTQKQRDLLAYINAQVNDTDVPPSFDEMKEALGLKSKSGIHRLINGLVERGYLERLPNRARALHIKRLPDGLRGGDVVPMPVMPNIGRAADIFATPVSGVQPIPLYGRIAAGTPIEAIRHEGAYFDAPMNMLGNGDYYALQVDGQSMINAGIHDRDIVIIKRATQAHNNQIVVALVNQAEVTLKRLQKEGATVSLVPENDDFPVQTYPATAIEIQGVLAALVRQYHYASRLA